MVPGISETERRITGLRYQELLAEANRQRRAASASSAPGSRIRVRETLGRHMGAVMSQVRHLLQGGRIHEAADPTAAPGTLAVH